jgi:hypothetical protein
MIWPPTRRITGLVYVAAFALDEGSLFGIAAAA